MYIIIIKAYIEYIYKKDIKVTRVHSWSRWPTACISDTQSLSFYC